MCFSATASFTVAAALVPAGVYCFRVAREVDTKWLPLAVFPFAFAVQQAAEGFVWTGLNAGDPVLVSAASRVFLFFSHFFWPVWVPLSVYSIENTLWRRRALIAFALVGGLVGLSVFLPVLFLNDWLSVYQVQHSIEYNLQIIYDDIASRLVTRSGYGALIAGSLFLSSDLRIRMFGGLVVGALLIADLYFPHALISMWCFFAAVLSGFITMILASESRQRTAAG